MRPPPSHLDLLRVARAVRRAGALGDVDRLHAELSRLRTDLLQHLGAEGVEGVDGVTARDPDLPSAVADVVRDGQRRLLDLLTELLLTTSGAADDCNCLVRAAEVDAALRRQARLEARWRRARRAAGAR